MNDVNVTFVFKPIGMCPKECITRLKAENGPKYKDMTMAFASRLDPMAYGIMPIIHHADGAERDRCQSSFNDSFKVYRFNVILGFQTDTFDILGMCEKCDSYPRTTQNIIECIETLSRITEQDYPVYSSKTVYSEKYRKMIPLWKLAKEKELPVNLPRHNISIQSFVLLSINYFTSDEVLELVCDRINTLPANAQFRQKEIIERWRDSLTEKGSHTVLQCEARVSSGTYIRGLANDMGGVCYDIFRTEIKDTVIKNMDSVNKYVFSIIDR